ncbi:hypothetical protein XANCAGTX0491_004804 [Xanthoria calcicola]
MQAPSLPASTPVQQPVRVRLACDSCSAAKVKCDRQRPACERCSSNQLQCVYGISRRHGCKRRAAANSAAAEHGPTTVPQQSFRGSGGSVHSASSRRRLDCDTVDFSAYDSNHVNGSSIVNEGVFDFHNDNDLPDLFQYPTDDDFAMNVDVDGSESSTFAFAHSLPTPTDSCQENDFTINQQKPGQGPYTPFTPLSSSSQDIKIPGFNLGFPAASKALTAYHRPTDSYRSSEHVPSSDESQETHNCEAYALSLLRSLHSWSLHTYDETYTQTGTLADSYQTNNNNNKNKNNTNSHQELPSLDTILHANKCALSGVMKLLDCRPCAQRPYPLTLYMSIITKMLSLYELAATADISSSSSSDAAASGATTPSSAPHHRLAPTTVMQVGVFDLDEDDQATLQRGILLRQLRKMERAIENFAALGGGGGGGDGGSGNEPDLSVRQWHSVAVSMMKKESSRIYQNCKERLLIIA